MAWPPAALANNKTNSTVMVDDHAVHHNAIADAVNDTVTEILNGVAASRSLIKHVKNASGGTLNKGDVVRVNGATGENVTVTKAQAASTNVPNPPQNNVVFGVVLSTSIADNGSGDILIQGTLTDLNTSAWNVGDFLYLSASTAGALTSTAPAASNERICLALVTKKDATEGQICVQVIQPVYVNSIVGMDIGTLANNDLISWNSTAGKFTNRSVSSLSGDTAFTGTFVPQSTTVSTSGTGLSGGGDLTANRTITLSPSTLAGDSAFTGAFASKTPTHAATLGTTGTVDLNMSTLNDTYQSITATGNITFTTSNRAEGRSVTIRIIAGASSRTITAPTSSVTLTTASPFTLPANKTGIFTITFFGADAGDGVVAWAVQP